MSLGQLLSIVRARWRIELFVLLLIVGAVTAATLLWPKQYTSIATVAIDIKSPDPIATVGALPGTPPSITSQVDLITSERVALRAIKSLGLDKDEQNLRDFQISAKGQGDFDSWLATSLLKKLDVKATKDSNSITIAYESKDPKFAAALANAFVRSYIAATLDLRVEPARQYNAFFEDRSKQLRDELERAQAKLSAYQQQYGIIATDERLDVENARLSELSSQLNAVQGATYDSSSRSSLAGANGSRMQEVLANPVVSLITSDISRQEVRLRELSERLGESHPQVKEARANLAELRVRLDAETRRVTGSLGINNDVNRSRLSSLKSAMDEQRQKLLKLRTQRDAASVLVRDVESAQRAYDANLARLTQSTLESQVRQTNVSVLKEATVPSFPSSPKTVQNIAFAIFAGLFLAIATGLLRELIDPRLRGAKEVELVLGQVLMGRIPAPQRIGQGAQAQARLMKARVLTGLPRPAAR